VVPGEHVEHEFLVPTVSATTHKATTGRPRQESLGWDPGERLVSGGWAGGPGRTRRTRFRTSGRKHEFQVRPFRATTTSSHHPRPGPRQESQGWDQRAGLARQVVEGWSQGETWRTRFHTCGVRTRVPGSTDSGNHHPEPPPGPGPGRGGERSGTGQDVQGKTQNAALNQKHLKSPETPKSAFSGRHALESGFLAELLMLPYSRFRGLPPNPRTIPRIGCFQGAGVPGTESQDGPRNRWIRKTPGKDLGWARPP